MKLKNINYLLIGVAIVVGLNSCSVATNTVDLEIPNQTFSFEDDNIAVITLNMKELIEASEGIEADKIEGATLNSLIISKDDSVGFSQMNRAEFMLSTDNEDIEALTVSILDTIEPGAKSIALSLMEGMELEQFLGEENVYLIMDANFLGDNEVTQKVEAGIKFDVEVEK